MMGIWARPIQVKRRGAGEGILRDRTLASYASDNYLGTLGIDLLRGRDFTRQEAAAGAHVAVISEGPARRFWPGEDPLGRRFQLDMHFNGKLTEFEVIGIARDVRFFSLTRVDPTHVYLATDPSMTYPVVLNIPDGPQAALGAVRRTVESLTGTCFPACRFGTRIPCWSGLSGLSRRYGHFRYRPRSSGSVAGRDRDLRCDGLCGQPKNPGNRCAHGIRSNLASYFEGCSSTRSLRRRPSG